ncbi:hypothetical protein [Mitsuaria sp. 7]|uniref:hypothetical protein n=1 Tax=Mitsuaria sp. 7 TaxID=1658665 RepID=UPI0007DE0C5F|nr:hypothetical protein [Mitsuaria sp. 7]ANH70941.1 hypothetical protein ABE85_25645 [Mitsuaria sp. 7]
MTSQIERMSEMSAVLKEVETWGETPVEVTTALQPETPEPTWTEGVDALLHLLRYPEKTNPYVVGQIPAPASRHIDWEEVRELLCRLFEENRETCVDAYLDVRLALGVLANNSVRLCRGPVDIHHCRAEDGFHFLRVTLSVDTDDDRTYELADELRMTSLHCNGRSGGFLVGFRSIHPCQPKDWSVCPQPDLDGDDDDGQEE